MNTKTEEVKERIKKDVKKDKILIAAIGILAFVLAFLTTDKISASLIAGITAMTIYVSFIALLSFAYVSLSFAYDSGKRAEIEREKQREIERKNQK